MTDKATPEDAIFFGPFHLAPAARRLDKAGVAVPLGGRAFDLLVVLAEHAGQVVSKRELMGGSGPM